MDLLRIGDKLISKRRIWSMIDRILELRMAGQSQQEVAEELGIDRTLISRLESIGEVRKGGRIAVLGFPILNKDELRKAVEAEGVEFVLLLNDKERWEFVTDGSGADLVNRLMEWLVQLKEFDAVIFIASDMRIATAQALLGTDTVIGVSLGPSPIQGDREVNVQFIVDMIRSLKV